MSRGSARNYGPHARSVGSPVLATVPATEAGGTKHRKALESKAVQLGINIKNKGFDVCLSRPTKKRERAAKHAATTQVKAAPLPLLSGPRKGFPTPLAFVSLHFTATCAGGAREARRKVA